MWDGGFNPKAFSGAAVELQISESLHVSVCVYIPFLCVHAVFTTENSFVTF